MSIKNQKPVEKFGIPQGMVNKMKSAAKALFVPQNVFVTRVADNQYKLVKGKLILRNPKTGHGYKPDGDSVRFVADNPVEMKDLRLFNYDPEKIELDGGIFQLRFEEIDATELHYREQAQPLGAWARDMLLQKIGFNNITYGPDGETVLTFDPLEIEAFILFKGYDVYGRPICYVYVGNPPAGMKSGDWVNLTTALLKESLNDWLLVEGIVYLTIYSSSPDEHQQILISHAVAAEKKKLNLWAIDHTREFPFTGVASIGPNSKVAILPKIARRLFDYVLDGGIDRMKFPPWLEWTETTNKNRNDIVIINGERKKLSELITHEDGVIRVLFDPIHAVFEEQEPAKNPIGKIVSRIRKHIARISGNK